MLTEDDLKAIEGQLDRLSGQAQRFETVAQMRALIAEVRRLKVLTHEIMCPQSSSRGDGDCECADRVYPLREEANKYREWAGFLLGTLCRIDDHDMAAEERNAASIAGIVPCDKPKGESHAV